MDTLVLQLLNFLLLADLSLCQDMGDMGDMGDDGGGGGEDMSDVLDPTLMGMGDDGGLGLYGMGGQSGHGGGGSSLANLKVGRRPQAGSQKRIRNVKHTVLSIKLLFDAICLTSLST